MENHHEFEAVFEGLPFNSALVDPSGAIVYVNAAWRKFAMDHDWEAEDFGLGLNYLEVCERADDSYAKRAASGIRRVLAGSLPSFSMEYTAHTGSGDEHYLMRVAPCYFEQGVHALVLHEQVTGRRRLDGALAEQEKLRTALQKEQALSDLKSDIMARLAHEFRTPLTILSNAHDLLYRYGDQLSDEQLSKQKHMIKLQITRMSRMLDDIALVVHGDETALAYAPDRVDVEAMCRDLIEEIEVASSGTHVLMLNVAGDLEQVWLDERLAHLILVNLITNSLKYSDAGTSVWLIVSRSDSLLEFSVRDEGRGIPLEEQQRIFQAFFRASNTQATKGLGLGLSIVARAVEAHRGSISFESKPGHGAVFKVLLPIDAPP